ncbi:MAG: biopolymer transporter ExbD [Opitutaceae bacterium]
MITRPLDLASKLRPAPRNFDFWFFVNIALIVFAFSLFGSRFVLAPGLGVDFQLPEMTGARAQAARTTHNIGINEVGLIVAEEGGITLERLGEWLRDEAKTTRDPVLLVRAEAGVKISQLTRIAELAKSAGFQVVLAGQEPAKASGGR